MKITKYPQSCLVVEDKGVRLVIDPGSFVADKYEARELGNINLILITHEHKDHLDISYLNDIIELNPGVEIWANQSVANLIPTYITKVVTDANEYNFRSMIIRSVYIKHVLMPNGDPGPENTGYIINDIFFHPGDGIDTNESADIVAAPLAGPDISPKDVIEFIKCTQAKTVVPIHYDYWPAKPRMFEHLIANNIKYIILNNGQSVNL